MLVFNHTNDCDCIVSHLDVFQPVLFMIRYSMPLSHLVWTLNTVLPSDLRTLLLGCSHSAAASYQAQARSAQAHSAQAHSDQAQSVQTRLKQAHSAQVGSSSVGSSFPGSSPPQPDHLLVRSHIHRGRDEQDIFLVVRGDGSEAAADQIVPVLALLQRSPQ